MRYDETCISLQMLASRCRSILRASLEKVSQKVITVERWPVCEGYTCIYEQLPNEPLKGQVFPLGEWYSCRGLALAANSGRSTLGFNSQNFMWIKQACDKNYSVPLVSSRGLSKHRCDENCCVRTGVMHLLYDNCMYKWHCHYKKLIWSCIHTQVWTALSLRALHVMEAAASFWIISVCMEIIVF